MSDAMMASMMLDAEDGVPNLSERRSPAFRRLDREGLDPDPCVHAHERGRAQNEQAYAQPSVRLCTSDGQEPPFASAPLSGLKAITLPKLILGKRHHGKFLRGRLCVKPKLISAIHSVLEDDAGKTVRLSIYNALPATASLRELEARFPLGMRVIVKEPFFKICADGGTAIRVDNPADIALEVTWKADSLPPHSTSATFIKELESIRSEGNKLFSEQDWDGAASIYSWCIDKAVSRIGVNKTASEAFNRLLLLAYSNRAEARLRLGAYDDALTDADKGIELDPKHVKTLVRKGRAAHGLGLYEKSIQIFEAALEVAPNEESILKALRASRTAYDQSETGHYNLSDLYSSDGYCVIPPLADFVGPVEIRRVNGGLGGRGLFATKNAMLGQLLLVSNPLAIVGHMSQVKLVSLTFRFQRRGTLTAVLQDGYHQVLIEELVNRVMTSKRKMAQLYSLSSYNKREMEIPSIELFRPGSEWVPPGAEQLEANVRLISEIAHLNALGSDVNFFTHAHNLQEKGDVTLGLWTLPSFVNHSCTPNCVPVFLGNTLFLRASVDIVEGEELTIPYLPNIFDSVETRQDTTKTWDFTCKCRRCILEETLQPQLPISVSWPTLKPESRTEGQKRRALEKLARVADEVEAVIQSSKSGLGPRQQGWIRASYICAYLAKFKLAMDGHHSESRIASLRLVVDSMSSVSVTLGVLRLAGNLLREIEQSCFKHSPSYRLEHDRVLGLYKIIFGKQPNSNQHKLIRGHWAPLSLEEWADFGL